MDRKYHWVVLFVSVLFICLFGFADYWAGLRIHLSVLFMIPVYFCTWFIGFRAGAFVSLLSSLTLLIGTIFFHHSQSSLGVVIFNVVSLFLTNTIFSLALALLKKKYSEFHEQLRHDGLTGLLNAEAFFELAELERLRSIRYGHPLTICFLDLDNFKQVNDKMGHLEGNEFLKMTAQILKKSIRETDQVARLGGDEFVILFPESGPNAAEALVGKIQDDLREAYREKNCETTPSFGVATFYEKPSSVNMLVSLVDELMYNAKNSGKNRIVAKVFGTENGGGAPEFDATMLKSLAR